MSSFRFWPGDYYAPSYIQSGFYASFSFQSSRHGYDPIYSHQRWEHRQDREWEHRVETSYQNRRDHESERPPRTWAAERSINLGSAESKLNHRMAAPINQLAKQKAGTVKFQPVVEAERQKLTQRSQAVQQSRDQRRTLETKLVDTAGQKSGGSFAPAKVQLPRSPIVSKPVSQLRKNQIPPQTQSSPKPDPKFQPKPDAPVRQPGVNRINPQPEPRPSGSEMKPSQPRLNEAIPRARAVLPEAPPRVLEPRPKSHDESPPSVSGLEKSASPITPPSARPRLDPNEKGAARLIRNYQSSAGNGSQPAPRSSPAPPRAIENPAAGGNNGPSPMDKEREKRAKD